MDLRTSSVLRIAALGVVLLTGGWVLAQSEKLGTQEANHQSNGRASCQGLPSHAQLKAALEAAVAAETSGLNNHMWATIVEPRRHRLRRRLLRRQLAAINGRAAA